MKRRQMILITVIVFILLSALHPLPKQTTECYNEYDVHEIKQVKPVAGKNIHYSMETITVIQSEPAVVTPVRTYLGEYEITAYCSCTICCGVETGLTSSGTHVEEGQTVACNSLPAGTKIYINGFGNYTVEDTGNIADNVIDIYIADHERALEFGRQVKDVYIE